MKKTIVYSALLSVLSTTAVAEPTNDEITSNQSTNAVHIVAVAEATPNVIPAAAAPTAPAAVMNTQTTTPTVAPAGQTVPAVPPPMNCEYPIPAETTHIEQAIITHWAEKAVEQSFEFDFANVDKQLTALQACYTDQGWKSFNDALSKSGNVDAIKSQKLTVSTMIDGTPTFSALKDNQWKVSIPLQVVYQNSKEKLTQVLSVDLIIGRKVSGNLGIMQMIASPRQTATPTATVPPQAK